MAARKRLPLRAALTLVFALTATTALVAAIWNTADETHRCLDVEPAVSARIASLPTDGPVKPRAAVAVRAPWIERDLSARHYRDVGAYYAVAMSFTAPDGTEHRGTWGVATGPQPAESFDIDTDTVSFESLDRSARQWTAWPPYATESYAEDSSAVADARACLERA
ncbi:hypothetical protein C8K36_107149 [Rhodococcus sp. OK519]|uniref:hypothetical protein n=1 Tax=Rhodococcus sp. OK519 TaxID=2135729 RepID=UPI000D369089|nr:hypothetical protein C8K36_107149 [Rhodococcus sp. OK519]